MRELLVDLERRRADLLDRLAQIGNFRPGSINALVRRCGKCGCRCARPGDPGHGPNLRLTYKLNGKTFSESLPDSTLVQMARLEIAEFRKFQRWSREFIDINVRICHLRYYELPGGRRRTVGPAQTQFGAAALQPRSVHAGRERGTE